MQDGLFICKNNQCVLKEGTKLALDEESLTGREKLTEEVKNNKTDSRETRSKQEQQVSYVRYQLVEISLQ
ncbi:MAG: hypothetical protein WBZ36_01690 [Candidatus Nitrosopolaris sp.]